MALVTVLCVGMEVQYIRLSITQLVCAQLKARQLKSSPFSLHFLLDGIVRLEASTSPRTVVAECKFKQKLEYGRTGRSYNIGPWDHPKIPSTCQT
jgi:hypothetical protein